MFEKETFDSHDHYGDPDVPRSDDLYKRCDHGNIMSECSRCEFRTEGDIHDDEDNFGSSRDGDFDWSSVNKRNGIRDERLDDEIEAAFDYE